MIIMIIIIIIASIKYFQNRFVHSYVVSKIFFVSTSSSTKEFHKNKLCQSKNL